ncbi:hypothetical protein HDU83_005626 [Entophlyctis luteolus]|nr:hypothetical protein HDU83_005626 [Entophlyctis luteolus]KAJ3388164.1 hypothetical protein HDU84_000244 [Entophlyctis sp. JEL0112]
MTSRSITCTARLRACAGVRPVALRVSVHTLPRPSHLLLRFQSRNFTTSPTVGHSHPSSPSDPSNPLKVPARMLIGFTCNKCNHRTHKLMSKQAYETGVVIIACEGCRANHLIADHLGWYNTLGGKVGTIEDIIKKSGGDREGKFVTRLRAQDVLSGGQGDDSNDFASDGLMEWLPKKADEIAEQIQRSAKDDSVKGKS